MSHVVAQVASRVLNTDAVFTQLSVRRHTYTTCIVSLIHSCIGGRGGKSLRLQMLFVKSKTNVKTYTRPVGGGIITTTDYDLSYVI